MCIHKSKYIHITLYLCHIIWNYHLLTACYCILVPSTFGFDASLVTIFGSLRSTVADRFCRHQCRYESLYLECHKPWIPDKYIYFMQCITMFMRARVHTHTHTHAHTHMHTYTHTHTHTPQTQWCPFVDVIFSRCSSGDLAPDGYPPNTHWQKS